MLLAAAEQCSSWPETIETLAALLLVAFVCYLMMAPALPRRRGKGDE